MMNLHSDGLTNSHILQRLLHPGQRLSHLDVDVLVLGPRSRQRSRLLQQLRYRRDRPAPYAVLPEEFLVPSLLKVPYITYGYSSSAHVHALENSIQTPLGEVFLEPSDQHLAAVALGLALRLSPEIMEEKLRATEDLSVAA